MAVDCPVPASSQPEAAAAAVATRNPLTVPEMGQVDWPLVLRAVPEKVQAALPLAAPLVVPEKVRVALLLAVPERVRVALLTSWLAARPAALSAEARGQRATALPLW
jgi:hypothetical protein